MKLVIILTLTFLLSACANGDNFQNLMETKAIKGVCYIKQVTRTTVVNGQLESLLGKVGADVQITETVDATYEDRDC